jgi:two-component system, NarL family, sensor kinase
MRAPGPEVDRDVERSEVRNAVARFLLTGLVTLAVVAAPATLVMQHIVRGHTLRGLEATTELMADDMMAPLLDDRFFARDPQAVDLVDRVVRGRVAGGDVVRITLWSRSGVILHSTATWLTGEHFPEHEWGDSVLVDGEVVANLEDRGLSVHDYERGLGEFVEVNAPFVAASGDDLILEAYFPARVVHAQQRDLLLSLLPAGLATLVALQLAQLPPAVRLARRIQGLQATRRRLLRQAAAASDLERRRIARDLHDEVIQDLAGASYALESLEGRLDAGVRGELERSRGIVRSSVGTLRGMLTELYPADLDSLGLPGAVDRLAAPLRRRGIDVRVVVPDDVPLAPMSATLLYRVAREALTNALKYAEPRLVTVTVVAHGHTVVLEVADDGVGFDTSAPTPEEHLGLRLIRDTVSEAGGHVTVHSAPGEGTRVTTTIPLA